MFFLGDDQVVQVKVFSDIIGNVTNQSQAGNISKTPEALWVKIAAKGLQCNMILLISTKIGISPTFLLHLSYFGCDDSDCNMRRLGLETTQRPPVPVKERQPMSAMLRTSLTWFLDCRMSL